MSHNDHAYGAEIETDDEMDATETSHTEQDTENGHVADGSFDTVPSNDGADTSEGSVTGTHTAHHYQEGEIDNDGYEHHYGDTGGSTSGAGQPASGSHVVTGSLTSRNAIEGSASDDIIHGGHQTDIIDGGDGNDHVEGNDGDDVLIGGNSTDSGHNHFMGGAGDDIMVASGRKTQDFDDLIQGNTGLNQTIHADAKYASVADIIDNNGVVATGQNTFEFQSGSTGHDLILNFHVETDRLVIQRNINGSGMEDDASLLNHVSTHGNDVTIDLGEGNSVTLVGVDATGFSLQNILFV